MAKTVAIIQSNYIPWKGYFNIIKNVDEFVLLDDVQFTRRDWRNRNLIKTKAGLKWLTIPVQIKGQYHAKIKDILTAGHDWRNEHWLTIYHAYKEAAYFRQYAEPIKDCYLSNKEESISLINLTFIRAVNDLLGIKTRMHWSMDFDTPEEKTSRLLHICKSLKATTYISGPAAKEYLDVELFNENGVAVKWADYSNYPEYNQLYPPFEHGVTILDLLFSEGPQTENFFKKELWA